jgi:hypothetical protein
MRFGTLPHRYHFSLKSFQIDRLLVEFSAVTRTLEAVCREVSALQPDDNAPTSSSSRAGKVLHSNQSKLLLTLVFE